MSRQERALVTGASGFIGGHLRRRLLDQGVEVHGVSRSGGKDDGAWHQADLTDPEAVGRLVRELEPDVIFHLASHVTGSHDLAEVVPTFQANAVSTVGLLAAAVESGCRRVVLAGSDKELGIGDGVPGSPYAAAKVAATGYARMFHAVYGLSVVNLRIFMVYGPGQADTAKLVPHTVTSLLAGIAPELSTGDRQFDWTYVDDVVEALLAAGEAVKGDDGAPIDIGTGKLTAIREVVEEIVHRFDGEIAPRFGALPDRFAEPGFAASLERARSTLGWRPRTSLAEGLDSTIAWYTLQASG